MGTWEYITASFPTPSLSLPCSSSSCITMFPLLVSLSLLCLVQAGQIPIQDCGSKSTIQKIEMEGCSAFPCIVHHGSHAKGKAYITATSTATSLTCKITGIVFGVELPFNGCPKNACEHMLEGDCPVTEGEVMVYDMDIPIEPMYPTIEITGRWELFDENGEDFLCFNIPMKIEA